jgi:hypothetical protein
VATPACGRRCTAQTRLQRPDQVFDEKPKRKTATRGDLAGGEFHDAWATGQDGNHKDPPRLLGSKGCKSGVRLSRAAVVGVGAVTSARRR